MSEDPWRYWLRESPFDAAYKRVEIVRPRHDQKPEDCEPSVITLASVPPEWNIAGVYWRPFY